MAIAIRGSELPETEVTRFAARNWRRRWELQQTRLVPQREARFEAILRALEFGVGRRPRVLDLGCGTGSLSERILVRFPGARVVAVDHDPLLLAVGSIGLGEYPRRLTWVDADLRSESWDRGLPPGSFDAAVSSTALHWLTPGEVGRLYRTLARRIRRRGLFLNADFIDFDPPSQRLRLIGRAMGRRWRREAVSAGESWSEFWRAILDDPSLEREAGLRRLRYPRSHTGTPTPDLEGHRRALRRAGFRESEVVWSQWRNRVLAAIR